MIIFDLDGTLADCTHRRHFVDPSCNPDYEEVINEGYMRLSDGWYHKSSILLSNPPQRIKFKPDWKAFYEACDRDAPIKPVIEMFYAYIGAGGQVEIWSGRCESVRDKTVKWLHEHVPRSSRAKLRMRPIGDSTPDDQLKEQWLDEYLTGGDNPIEMVLDDRKKVIDMWIRRGVFVFDVSQGKGNF